MGVRERTQVAHSRKPEDVVCPGLMFSVLSSPPVSVLLSAGVTGTSVAMPGFLCGYSGFELGFSCLHSKRSATEPSLQPQQ